MADKPVKWIPKKIGTSVEYRSGQTPKAEELNSWFNLLINQGDWNADRITDLLNTEEIRKDLSEEALSTILSHIEEARLTYAELVEFYSGVAQTLDDVDAIEALRQVAEAARVTAESQRQANTAAAIADTELATQSANTAADRVDNTIADAELATSEAVTATTNADTAASEASDAAANAIDVVQNLETTYAPRLTDVEDEISTQKEDYANYQSSNNLKIATVEKELNDYKSTMANVNVNQEAKQSASGYGVVSLPRNAANGQVGASLKGFTATNLIENGNFKDELQGWDLNGLSLIAIDDIRCVSGQRSVKISLAPTDGSPSARLTQDIEVPAGHKVYYAASIYCTNVVTNVDGVSPVVRHRASDYGVYDNNVEVLRREASLLLNQWERLSLVRSVTESSRGVRFELTANASAGSELDINVDDFLAIDLTQTFGTGNEPTVEECDKIFANYFDGTKSTVSASRLKSVGKNLFDKNMKDNLLNHYSEHDGRIWPSDRYSTTGFIRVKSLTTYSQSNRANGALYALFYDSQKNLISVQPLTSLTPVLINTPPNCAYMRTAFTNAYGSFESLRVEEGTKNTPYEPYTESTQYLPNVGELRSLPNGVKDEIRVSGGKAEHIKRIDDDGIAELASPIVIPINVSGGIVSNPSGTIYVDPVVADAGMYTDKLSVLNMDLPINYIEKLSKVDFNTGVETELDSSKCVIAEDKLSFTHPDLTSNDIVFFTYFHNLEGTQGETTIEYYDSRHTLKDSVTGKFYKIAPTVADGVLTNQLVEV